MQVVLLVHPVAQRDDDVALDALRPLRLGVRQLALGDAVGPVAEVLERRAAEIAGQLQLTIISPAWPDCTRRIQASSDDANVAEASRNRARREVAELMAADAAVVLHRVEPVGAA